MSFDRSKCWAVKAATVTAMVLIAGCATKPPPAPTPPRPGPSVPAEVALAPNAYMREASSISLFAVRASQLVAVRNVGVTGIARTIEQEQGGVASQLSYAGRRVNLLPSANLLPEHEAMLAVLDSSPDMAALYKEQMRIVLSRGESIHRAFAASGTSPTLRPVAKMAEPVFQRELTLVR